MTNESTTWPRQDSPVTLTMWPAAWSNSIRQLPLNCLSWFWFDTGLHRAHWGLDLIPFEETFAQQVWGWEQVSRGASEQIRSWAVGSTRCMWVARAQHNKCPFDPRAKVYPLTPQRDPERWRPRTLGQRGELQKRWGRAEASSGRGRSEREVTLRIALRHGLHIHQHT